MGFADEKVAMATRMYDQVRGLSTRGCLGIFIFITSKVDRYIRSIDLELKKFAAELEATSSGITLSLDRSKCNACHGPSDTFIESLEMDAGPRRAIVQKYAE